MKIGLEHLWVWPNSSRGQNRSSKLMPLSSEEPRFKAIDAKQQQNCSVGKILDQIVCRKTTRMYRKWIVKEYGIRK